MKYFSITITYGRFIKKVLNGDIKLDVFRKYNLPSDRKELEDNDKKMVSEGESPDVGSIFLLEVEDIVEKAFRVHNLVYRHQYSWPNEGRCVYIDLTAEKKHEHYGWSSGDYYIWTKAEDVSAYDAVRLSLEVDGILLQIHEIEEEELNENPYKFKDDKITRFSTVKEYIDSES